VTRTMSQGPRESEAEASILGKNIPGCEQRTGLEAIRRKDRVPPGKSTHGSGRVRSWRLDRAGTSSGLSNEQVQVLSSRRTCDSDEGSKSKGE
jgi:hypothetical protein